MNSLKAFTFDLVGILEDLVSNTKAKQQVNLKVACIGYSNVMYDSNLVFPGFQGTGPKKVPGLYNQV